jgi:hypothetical protein
LVGLVQPWRLVTAVLADWAEVVQPAAVQLLEHLRVMLRQDPELLLGLHSSLMFPAPAARARL